VRNDDSELRDIAAFGELDANRIAAPFACIVFFEPSTEPSSLDADDGVHSRVKGLFAIKDVNPDRVLLEPVLRAG
jgi:hypothetical protein